MVTLEMKNVTKFLSFFGAVSWSKSLGMNAVMRTLIR